tara:strand:+ start:870 stop:1346 length:477 start_codon:yes stop_codon:yes gene_type:complete
MRKRKKGHSRAVKHKFDGIQFASGLELYCYQQLKKARIPSKYEGQTFELLPSFKYEGTFMDRGTLKGAKVYKEKSTHVRNISYTPDFINLKWGFVIETKGFRNETFPMRFKLFKNYLKNQNLTLDLYVPSTKKEVDITILKILERKTNTKNGTLRSGR